MLYPWIKTLHIVLVIGWFAGLVGLSRLYVTLSQTSSVEARVTLHGMARRLLFLTTLLAVPAVLLGLWLFGVFGIGKGPGGGWLHAKVFFVLLMIVFHFVCFIVLVGFENGKQGAGAGFCRRFAYMPALLFPIIVALAVLKPF